MVRALRPSRPSKTLPRQQIVRHLLLDPRSLPIVARLTKRVARPKTSRPPAPVVDPVVVGGEAVVDAPQDCLGATGDTDLAVERADVGLHGVGRQIGAC